VKDLVISATSGRKRKKQMHEELDLLEAGPAEDEQKDSRSHRNSKMKGTGLKKRRGNSATSDALYSRESLLIDCKENEGIKPRGRPKGRGRLVISSLFFQNDLPGTSRNLGGLVRGGGGGGGGGAVREKIGSAISTEGSCVTRGKRRRGRRILIPTSLAGGGDSLSTVWEEGGTVA